MIKLDSNLVAFFDVDDTLIEWELREPSDEQSVNVEFNGNQIFKRPIIVHINELINQKYAEGKVAIDCNALVIYGEK